MNAKRCKRLSIGFLIVIVICWLAGQYDYSRLVAGKQPVFARWVLHLADGGSVQYIGPGYSVTELHELRWGIEMQPDIQTNASYKIAPYAPYRIGEVLDYWTPFMSREQTRFIVETNK